MYIVRWLMGHPIIATWVLVAVATLLTFGSGSKIGNGDAAENKVASTSHESVEEVKAETNTHVLSKEAIDKSIEIPPAKVEILQSQNKTAIVKTTDAVISHKVDAPVSAKENNTKNVSFKKPPFNNAKEDSKKTPVTEETKSIPETKEDSASTASAVADIGQSTSEEMLLMAREAYWNNGLDEAAQIYEKLIEIEPKVLEHKGELGNVYWRQGYPKKAAELYSEIAIPMIEQGGAERVANMIGFIGLFYPDRAAEIHKRIQSSRQRK